MGLFFSCRHTRPYYCAFVVRLKLGSVTIQTLFSFSKTVLALGGFSNFRVNFRINLLISAKGAAGILIRIHVELVDLAGEYCYLNFMSFDL